MSLRLIGTILNLNFSLEYLWQRHPPMTTLPLQLYTAGQWILHLRFLAIELETRFRESGIRRKIAVPLLAMKFAHSDPQS